MPAYELYGLASFFPHFRLSPVAGPRVRICRDLICALAGSQGLLTEAQGAARRERACGCTETFFTPEYPGKPRNSLETRLPGPSSPHATSRTEEGPRPT